MFLSLKKYLEKVITAFGIRSCKPIKTPLAINFKLSSLQCPKTNKEKNHMLKISYANVVVTY